MNEVFKALRDPTRRDILQLLRDSPLTAGSIAEQFDISKPSISHHLDVLKRAELVRVERRGQYLEYTLNTTVVDELLQWIIALNPTQHD